MYRTSLLLLSLLIGLSAVLAEAQATSPKSASTIASVGSAALPAQVATAHSLPIARAGDGNIDAASSEDDICYKIRAYIFKRDDDHAPEFVRSTTCGPRTPHTKNAAWPQAKLVPAR